MTQPPQYQQPYQGQPYQGGPYQQQPYPQQQHQAPPGPYAPQPHPQQQYPQPQGYQQPYPAQQPAGYPPQGYRPQDYQPQSHRPQAQPQGRPGVACRLCGSAPAADATFRGVVGAVFMHTIWTARGPYCRDCGMHTFRRQTTRTLTGGWCSVGALVLTPIFLLMNLSARGKVAGLPAPQPWGGHQAQAPLDPGPPVFQRPGAYVYPALAFLFLVLVIIGNLGN